MRLTVLGTGCPIPDPRRAQAGYLLEKSGRLILVDCGSGVLSQLARLEVNWAQLDTFLITHFHLDHMSDLLPLLTARWLMGFPQANIYGPEGTRELITQLVELFPYVRDHVALRVHDLAPGSVHSLAGFAVSTLALRHYVPSLAYKFDEKLVICGDSEPLPELKEFATGCQLLVHECSFLDGQSAGGHATPTALGKALAGTEVEWLLLTHLYPEAAARNEELANAVRKHFTRRVSVASDLQRIDL